MPDYKAQVAGLYPLGSGIDQALANGTSIDSSFLNARDLGQPGAPDFVLLGPGSQVWILGYSVRVGSVLAPTDELGLTMRAQSAYETLPPFIGSTEASLILPIYLFGILTSAQYQGRFRIEAPAALLSLFNNTGQTLTVSFQFWGKGL